MNLKQHLSVAAALLLSIFLPACGGTLYESAAWTPPNAEADWDIASLVCEDQAAKHVVVEKKKEQPKQPVVSNWRRQTEADIAAAAIVGLVGGLAKSGSEISAKNEVFRKCMTKRGWSLINDCASNARLAADQGGEACQSERLRG